MLSREQILIAYGLCSLIAKLLFAGSVSDAHIGLTGGIQNLKLVTEKALNHTRRQFLRYVFHEVRVPLNTITMGLMVLKEDESVLCEASKEALGATPPTPHHPPYTDDITPSALHEDTLCNTL